MEQDVKDKFELNEESHSLLLSRIKDNKFEARVFVAIVAVLMVVIIAISGSVLRYSKDTYKAQINRYDYNHAIDNKLNALDNKINSINLNITNIDSTIYNMNCRDIKWHNIDSIMYNIKFKPIVKHYVMPAYKLSKSNKEEIDNLHITIDSIKNKMHNSRP